MKRVDWRTGYRDGAAQSRVWCTEKLNIAYGNQASLLVHAFALALSCTWDGRPKDSRAGFAFLTVQSGRANNDDTGSRRRD